MTVLVDSNVLLCAAQPSNPMHADASGAIEKLMNSSAGAAIAIQNVAEYWNVATRPVDKNGFGFTIQEAEQELLRIEELFTILHEDLSTYAAWRSLVTRFHVRGIQVHDARLASLMLSKKIHHILTFNVRDFSRYPGITALHPTDPLPML